MCGFICGLIVGGVLFGGSNSTTTPDPHIPLRCLSALEISENAYKECRVPSLYDELFHEGALCRNYDQEKKNQCNFEFHLTFEIQALREMQKAQQEKINK